MTRPIATILVVEDEMPVLRALVRRAARFTSQVLEARTVAGALEHLQGRPDLIILDVRLPDGNGDEVARAARDLSPRPMIVALSGKATATEAFALAQLGVGAYLAKPIVAEELSAAIEQLRCGANPVREAAADAVGQMPLRYVQKNVRSAMVAEALAQTSGNLSHAAELLGITRQAIQHYLRKSGDDPDPGTAS